MACNREKVGRSRIYCRADPVRSSNFFKKFHALLMSFGLGFSAAGNGHCGKRRASLHATQWHLGRALTAAAPHCAWMGSCVFHKKISSSRAEDESYWVSSDCSCTMIFNFEPEHMIRPFFASPQIPEALSLKYSLHIRFLLCEKALLGKKLPCIHPLH